MNDSQAVRPIPRGMPTYLDSLLSTVLVGAGAALVKQGALTQPELSDAVAAIVTLAGVAWAVINANPDRRSPIAILLSLVKAAPADGQAAWNHGLSEAEADLLARLTPVIHAEIKARAGLLAGPLDTIADAAARQAADAAASALRVPHLSVNA